ncbi:MAG: hypothetical protein GY898_30945 [Proteobacteria bacterium]|nr:hypothetical protein [Pseudomonadota bacterium]
MTAPGLRWLPNGLTVARLVLAFAFPFLPEPARVPVFAIALVTEWADGFLARKLDVISDFGRRLDPVADKAFVLAVLTTILLEGLVTLPELVLVGIRDLAVFAACLVLLAMGKKEQLLALRPRPLGKVTTAAQFLFLGWVLIAGGAPVWLVGIAAALGTAASVDYARAFPRGPTAPPDAPSSA